MSRGSLRHAEASRLRLAALEPSDADEVQRLTDEPAITSAIDFLPEPFTQADSQALIATQNNGLTCFLGVRLRADDVLVVVCGAHLRGCDTVEIGYWVGSRHQGRGIAFEAASALIAALGDLRPDRRVYAECRPANTKSWRVLAKLGLRSSGEPGVRPGRVCMVMS